MYFTHLVRFFCTIFILSSLTLSHAQEAPYYQIEDLPIPEDIFLEVGGLVFLPDGSLAACTRRGEIWICKDPYSKVANRSDWTRFAQGLHEPLGLNYRDGAIYAVQRGELTRMRDENGDGKADVYETVYSWPLSGNYHDYSYGPLFLPNGNMMVALNLSWIGYGASLVKWRGWMLEITEDGEMMPYATGMRSPAGFGLDGDGELFYSDNQGDWVGSGRVTHVEKGDFVGNPQGLKWAAEPNSPVELRFDNFQDSMGILYDVAQQIEGIKSPVAWFPHAVMGISTSSILRDETQGRFGPFEDQMFIGDQGQSKIMRMYLEKVNGEYQGIIFPFREGFSSGVLRTVWGKDGSMFVGMTNRGWASTGKAPYGIQRLKWTGRTPFEIKAVNATPNGFKLTFTQPVNTPLAQNPANYSISGFTYKYHSTYGSPAINIQQCPITDASVSPDGLSVELTVEGLRQGYVHEIKADKLTNKSGNKLLHPIGYYTLNYIPGGGSATAGSSSANTSNTASAKRINEMPASWNGQVDESFTIGTLPGMKYDITSLKVKAGSKVKLVFNNNDDMEHNWSLVMPGTADEVGLAAQALGIEGPNKGYIPDTDKVLYHTALLKPETTETIYFKVPEQTGYYSFVCTVPGHHISMRGVLQVTK